MRTRPKKQLTDEERNKLQEDMNLEKKLGTTKNLLKEWALYDNASTFTQAFEKEIEDMSPTKVCHIFRHEIYWFIKEMDQFGYVEEGHAGFRDQNENDLENTLQQIRNKV